MSRFSSLQTQTSGRVYLNVYDLHQVNENLYYIGLGMYHSGVQVGGLEWSFAGGAGVFSDSPKSASGATFRESIDMGVFSGTSSDLDSILDDLRPHFRGDKYNILSKNCNSFSDALCQKLVRKPIPGFVNRMATIGTYFECIIPNQLKNAQGPGSTNNMSDEDTSNPVFSGAIGRRQQQTYAQSFSGSAQKLGGTGTVNMQPMAISSSGNDKEKARAARLAMLSG
jgi:hypothetical protein